jgi:hypothetical protein
MEYLLMVMSSAQCHASADAAADFLKSTVTTRRRLYAIVGRAYLKYRGQNVLHAQLQPILAEVEM